ncbi:MAG: LysR substrate-binding domain-containing protein [Ramlibacter sp.]|nr:LysR substrate-binding domain-containing protein [Ramlibacter sp.]
MGLLIPPLPALRAFDAVARERNLRRAAESLNVTHGAISHQLKALEEFLGVSLVDRGKRSTQLTPSGQQYLASIRPALDALSAATLEIRGVAGRRLSLNVLPSLASRWLMARVGEFMQRHPGIDLRIAATQELVNPTSGAEVALRYGPGPWPHVSARHLRTEELFPVAAPSLWGKRPRTALTNTYPLLRDTHESWRPWLAEAGLAANGFRFGARFDDSGLLLQAAEAGQGVALARSLLAMDALRTGRLVRIGRLSVVSPNSYYLICGAECDLAPAAQLFADWLETSLGSHDFKAGATLRAIG